MTPADPVWLLAEILASLARFYRDQRKKKAERSRYLGLLPQRAPWAHAMLSRFPAFQHRPEPDRLPDLLYARVQSSLTELGRRRDIKRTRRALDSGEFPESPMMDWRIEGREVVVHEEHRPLFRAVWSERESGWRLFWSRNSERWWPYVNGSHLTIGSFESCVKEVERDPHECFPPADTQVYFHG